MKDDTYNGWTNYETWNWKLWLDSDQCLYEYWQERAIAILSEDIKSRYSWETVDQLRRSMLVDELQSDCDERLDFFTKEESGPFIDILNTGLQSINWHEIADSLLEERKEQEVNTREHDPDC